jgi:glycosyltransferase involved in cell wall biosynthesis
MNIAIDIRALSNKKLTGIGKYIYHSIENILELDKNNKYYLFSSGLKDKIPNSLNFVGNFQYIHIAWPNKLLNFALWLGLVKLDKFLPDDTDLVWLPNLNFARFSKNLPFILTIHDLSFLHSREFYSVKRRHWHKLVNVSYLVENAQKIITVSANTKRDILRFFTISEDKIAIINPGVGYNKISNDEAKRLIYKFKLKDDFYLYIGTLEPRKNILSIIRAFDHFHNDYPDSQLVIVGTKGWIYNKLLKSIKRRPWVSYLGYIDGLEKDALYQLCQAFIWPSFYEGFGFPPMEALAHNKPLIVSYKTSLPEIIGRNAIYIDPYNISDIYRALKNLKEDEALRKKMFDNSKNYVLQSWPEQVKEVIKVFNSFSKKNENSN